MELTLISGAVDLSVKPREAKKPKGASILFIRVQYTNDYKYYTSISVGLIGTEKKKFEKYTSDQKFDTSDTLGIEIRGHLRVMVKEDKTQFVYLIAEHIVLYNITAMRENDELNMLNHLYRNKVKNGKEKENAKTKHSSDSL